MYVTLGDPGRTKNNRTRKTRPRKIAMSEVEARTPVVDDTLDTERSDEEELRRVYTEDMVSLG